MNESNPIPPQVPPQIPTNPPPPPPPRPPVPPIASRNLGDDPEDHVPITNPIAAVEAILRQPRRLMYQLRQPGAGPLMFYLALIAVVCAAVYGLVVGAFSGKEQYWIAPVKITSGMMISALICLPSLYIFTCLSGSRARLAEIFGLVMGMLMLTTMLLIGFAPVAWLFSQSTESINLMGALHLMFWFIAAFFGLRFLNHAFSYSQAKSSLGFNTWILIFMLVSMQMTTTLRPIIGRAPKFFPETKQFFLYHWADCLKQEPKADGQEWTR